MSETREQRQAYLLLRLLTGLDFFGHGFARIFTGTHLTGFAEGMVKSMASTPLPASLTLATGYIVPPIELLIGILLLAGLFTRFALTLASLLMMVLMFGVTLKQDWATAGSQLIYGLVLAVLLFARERYDLSWPSIFALIRLDHNSPRTRVQSSWLSRWQKTLRSSPFPRHLFLKPGSRLS